MDYTKLEPFLLLAKTAKGRAAAEVVQKVTSDDSIFAFGELLDSPGITELQSSDAPTYNLLRLFCYGTWSDYKAASSSFPQLDTQQQLKLKQLTVVSLAAASKKLHYTNLMSQLDIQNVRELEDLLISDCFYTGLVTGKLDQRQRCLHVEHAVARDIRQEDLHAIIKGFENWLHTSQAVLQQLDTSRLTAQEAAKAAKQHQAEVEAGIEIAKKGLENAEAGSKDVEMLDDMGTLDMMELEDRSAPAFGDRSKRRRRRRPDSNVH